MPGSTPKYGFPYPLGTDPISDGDDQIKALAEKVELFTNPSTGVAFAYGGGVNDIFDGSRVFKSGAIGMILVSIQVPAGAAAGAVLLAAPAGYRPVRNWRGTMWVQSSSVNTMAGVYLQVGTGNFYCEGALEAGGVLIGNLAYPLA